MSRRKKKSNSFTANPTGSNSRGSWVIGGLLVLGVVLVFGQTSRFDFVDFDDYAYVYENQIVKEGLTLDGFAGAFTTAWGPYWHPVTWLSHMLDCQLFGIAAGGHHAVNVAWHACNTILLFLALWRMTGSQWRSAMVAALFAVHPLHVESVAWIAERKDVLSGFFFMLTLLAYQSYVRLPNWRRYACVLLAFILGLMSKPMLVTLPPLLLLLDYWPLKRWRKTSEKVPEGVRPRLRTRITVRLVMEKLPLVAVALAISVATWLVQRQKGAMSLLGNELTLPTRIGNAMVAYVTYLVKALWPSHLAPFYAYVLNRPSYEPMAAAAILLAISAATIWLVFRRPYLFVGWFWYLGTLVPVIGLVQVGSQAMGDRFTYLPLIGIFIAGVWAVCDLLEGQRYARKMLAIAAAAILVACMIVSERQVSHWVDTESLFRHTLRATPDNALPHRVLGEIYVEQGRYAEAEAEFREMLRLDPTHFESSEGLLADALHRQGRSAEAVECYRKVLRKFPENAGAHNNLGMSLALQGQAAGAIEQFREALRLEPDRPEALRNLAWALATCPDRSLRNGPEAVRLASLACKLASHKDPMFPRTLADAYLETHNWAKAAEQLRAVLQRKPDDADAHLQLGNTLLALGDGQEAVAQLREAIRWQPRQYRAYNDLARIKATHPDATLRNGAEAVELAERAVELSDRQNPAILDTLAAAYAEAGRFPEAVRTVQEAINLATKQGKATLAESLISRLRLYTIKTPLREQPKPQ